jgi:SAM-dependent methyltransferase
MDARVFRRVQRYGCDAATEAYDRGWVPFSEPLTESCVAHATPVPGERVLDLATGTGVAAFAAARAVGPAGAVTGLDISEKMVALAASRAVNGGVEAVTGSRVGLDQRSRETDRDRPGHTDRATANLLIVASAVTS